MKNINFRGGKGRLNREGRLINFLPLRRGGGLVRGRGLIWEGSLIEDLRYVVACQNLIITVPHFNFISLIFFSTTQLTWVYHSLVKNINFRGGKGRLNREGGLINFLPREVGGGGLVRGRGLIWEGELNRGFTVCCCLSEFNHNSASFQFHFTYFFLHKSAYMIFLWGWSVPSVPKITLK